MNLSEQVSDMVAELQHFRTQSDSDGRLIALLKRQNQQQALEIIGLTRDRENEVRALTQERDEAVRKAAEVSGILNIAAHGIVSGLRRMKGDETPEVIPDHPDRVTSSVTDGMDEAASAEVAVVELMQTRRKLPAASFR